MKTLKKYYKFMLSLLLVGLFVWYFLANKKSFQPVFDVQLKYLSLVAVLDVILMCSNGLFLKFIVEPFNKKLKYSESVYVSVLSSIGNFFAPAGGGLGYRAVYLKSKHKLSYADYISTLSGNYIVIFLVTSFFGLVSLLSIGPEDKTSRFIIISLVLLGFFIGSIITMLLPPLKDKTIDKIKQPKIKKSIKLLNRVANGWDIIKKDKGLIVRLTVVTLLSFFTSCIINYLIAGALNISLSISGILLMTSLGSLSFVINITPANLGVKEAIYAFSATAIGITAPQALAIALIDRGVLFFTMAIMWIITSKIKNQFI